MLRVCDKYTSIVECFAAEKQGFCEHYATTMAILLRQANVPSRLVEGFLPGDLDPATGKEEIRTGGAHAWVEVYFPGYGWQMFDPTGRRVSRTDPLPAGKVVPIASAAPVPTFGRSSDDPAELEGLLAEDAVVLVDIRNQGEVEQGRIPGSVHIPLAWLVPVDLLPTTGSIVVHCADGWRSSVAASLLRAEGFDAVADSSSRLQRLGRRARVA